VCVCVCVYERMSVIERGERKAVRDAKNVSH
jgi:hypothetical protein